MAPENRKCTDAFCGIFFWTTIVAMIGVSGYCIVQGNIETLIAPVDGERNICGVGAANDYPYLFFEDADTSKNITNLFAKSVCVKECPTAANQDLDCFVTPTKQVCHKSQYGSKPFGLLCFPNDATESFTENWNEFMDSDAGHFLNDVYRSWKSCVICLVLGVVYTVIFMYALAYCTTCLAFISIGCIEIMLLGGMGSAVYLATDTSNADPSGFWYMFGGFLLTWLIFNLCLCCCWKKVKVAIAVIDATADFLVATFRLAFVNLSFAFLLVIYLIVATASVLCVTSMNEITASDDPNDFQGKVITWSSTNYGFMIFIGIAWIWIFSYLFDQITFVTMSSAAQFYFTSTHNSTGAASVMASVTLANFKHMGTIAVGSGIHTLLVIFHILNEAGQNAAQKSNNGAAKVIFCIL